MPLDTTQPGGYDETGYAKWASSPDAPSGPITYQDYQNWKSKQGAKPVVAATAAPSSAGANAPDPDVLPPSAFAGSDPEVLPKEAFAGSTPVIQPKAGLDGAIAGLKYRDKVAAAAKKYGLPNDVVPVLMAQGGVESGWDPKATSKAGAQGLFQLMPDTAKNLGVTDPYDPDQNIDGAVKYASQLYNKFHGSIPMMVRAYNAGPDNPSNWNNPETNAYAEKVLPAAGPEAQEEDASLMRALGRPANEKWGFGQELTQAASLGLAKPAQAALESLTNNTPYHMEKDLEDQYQQEYKANNFGAGVGADVLGSIVPGVGEAKLAMAGGRALASAVPALAGPLSVALGLGQKGSMGTGWLANLIRSIPAGAAQGAASSQVDTGTSPLEQTLVGGALGPFGHLLVQPIEYGAQAAVSGLSRLGYGAEDWIKQGQQRIGELLGNAPPPTDSEIPGVNRTLPEGLLGSQQGGVPQVTKLYAELSKKAPEMAAPVEQANDLARLQHFHGTLAGSPMELAALREEIKAAGGEGREFTKKMGDMPVNQEGPGGETPLNVLVNRKRTDVVDAELDSYQKVLRRVSKALYRQKAGQAEPIVPEDLEGADFSGLGPENKQDTFSGTLDLQHHAQKGFKGFVPKFSGDRYDGLGGTFGKDGVYLDQTHGDWRHMVGSETHNISAPFHNAYVLSPNTIDAFLDKFRGVAEGSDIAKQLKAEGYDGIIVHGFGKDGDQTNPLPSFEQKVLKNGVSPEVLQGQVFHFYPENVKYNGLFDPKTASPIDRKIHEVYAKVNEATRQAFAWKDFENGYGPKPQGAVVSGKDLDSLHKELSGLRGEATAETMKNVNGAQPDKFDEDALERDLTESQGKGPPKQLKQTAEELFGIRKLAQELLDDKDRVPSNTTKAFLTDLKNNIDSRLETNPQYKAWLEDLNGKYKRSSEMELLQTKGPQEFNSKNMVPQLARLSQMIKNAPNVVGVTSKKALPKSVSVDTAGEIDKLLKDASISRQAGAAHGGSMAGEEGGEAPIGLMHWGMGTGGSALGGALGGPVGGTLGWMGGMAAHVLARRQAAQNLSNYERGTLMALLYPKQYPPIMPKANKLTGGVVGSGLGASTGNALLNFGVASGQ